MLRRHVVPCVGPWKRCCASADVLAPNSTNISVSRWLFGCAGVVAGVVVVGGITRLTESGLSIVEWKPLAGVVPPLTEQAWLEEFERYKKFPGFQQRPDTTLSQFKYIFFWEWFHRFLARSLGVAFGIPAVYYASRGRFTGHQGFQASLVGLFCLGGCQGALGWYMVKSGLNKNLLDKRQKATVSAYRLASHLSLAFTIYVGMLTLAFSLRLPHYKLTFAKHLSSIKMLRGVAHGATGLMFVTAISGAFVAGLDAGLLYNDTFPLMGTGVIPPIEDLTALSPLWRNLFENHSMAQLWHRLMAGGTTCGIIALNVMARRSGVYPSVPLVARSLKLVNAALTIQVLLGMMTIMTYVHLHVAASHQAGSLVLLTSLVYLSCILSSRGRALPIKA